MSAFKSWLHCSGQYSVNDFILNTINICTLGHFPYIAPSLSPTMYIWVSYAKMREGVPQPNWACLLWRERAGFHISLHIFFWLSPFFFNVLLQQTHSFFKGATKEKNRPTKFFFHMEKNFAKFFSIWKKNFVGRFFSFVAPLKKLCVCCSKTLKKNGDSQKKIWREMWNPALSLHSKQAQFGWGTPSLILA